MQELHAQILLNAPETAEPSAVHFRYRREEKQNPYTGFVSFQHFSGEKLYSDCVIEPRNKAGTETEAYECYPVPQGVEENGREQGFYPENTVAYFRVLWKEFEPEQGRYEYGFIEEILRKAKEHGQVLMFRLMPHSTCARDDVPEWLKEIMECPARPDGMRVKDSPTDPRFLPLFSKAIRALGERFDSDKTLYSVDISLPGAWGEGTNVEQYAPESLKNLYDTYIEAFPNTFLMGQIGNVPLLETVSARHPVGYRGDGIGYPVLMENLYPGWIEHVPENLWKTAPVSFESFWWTTQWYRLGWDLDEIIEKTLKWHISTFNPKSFPQPEEWKDKIESWISRMGYHFVIRSVSTAKKDGALQVDFRAENIGSAPIYVPVPLNFRLKNAEHDYVFRTDADLRKWIGSVQLKVQIPLDGIAAGSYRLEAGICGEGYPAVQFASDAGRDGDYSVLASAEI